MNTRKPETPVDVELEQLGIIIDAMKRMDAKTRDRVVDYLISRYQR